MNPNQYTGLKKRRDRKNRHIRRAKDEENRFLGNYNRVIFLKTGLIGKMLFDPNQPSTKFSIDIELTNPMTAHELYKKIMKAIN